MVQVGAGRQAEEGQLRRLHARLRVDHLRVGGAGVAPVGQVEPARQLHRADVAHQVLGRVVGGLHRAHVEHRRADAEDERRARLAQLVDDEAEQRLGRALGHVAGDGDRRRAAGERRRGVHARDAAVGAEQQLVDGLDRVAAARWSARRTATKYGLAASSASPPRTAAAMSAITARSPAFSATTTSGLVVFSTMARKLCEQGDVRVVLARVRVGHHEVDLRQGVAEARGHLAVGEGRRPVLAGLHVVDAGDRRAVAEVGVVAAERHRVLAGPAVDLHDRRRRPPRLLHELARDLDEVGLVDLGARRAQQFERLGMMHALADGAHDLQRGLVDRGLVVVGQIGDAGRHGSALRAGRAEPGSNPATSASMRAATARPAAPAGAPRAASGP